MLLCCCGGGFCGCPTTPNLTMTVSTAFHPVPIGTYTFAYGPPPTPFFAAWSTLPITTYWCSTIIHFSGVDWMMGLTCNSSGGPPYPELYLFRPFGTSKVQTPLAAGTTVRITSCSPTFNWPGSTVYVFSG